MSYFPNTKLSKKLQQVRPIPDLTEAELTRFLSKIKIGKPDECWTWLACQDKKGYGIFQLRGHAAFSHRIAFFLAYGNPPQCKPMVCHSCDTPNCCNYHHLWSGDDKDNSDDCISKNRHNAPSGENHWSRKYPEKVARGNANGARKHPERLPRGDAHYMHRQPEQIRYGSTTVNAKLTETDIPIIRQKLADGFTLNAVGKEFGVKTFAIWAIKHRKHWQHVP